MRLVATAKIFAAEKKKDEEENLTTTKLCFLPSAAVASAAMVRKMTAEANWSMFPQFLRYNRTAENRIALNLLLVVVGNDVHVRVCQPQHQYERPAHSNRSEPAATSPPTTIPSSHPFRV